jgi:hypothetical protein
LTTKSAIALAALLAVGLVASGVTAGCDSGNILTCGRVVDSTGYKQGPLTVDLAIASLTAMPIAGGTAGISGGRPTSADVNPLDTMAVELMGYSGSRLADDAQAFAVTEFNYHPAGPVDASYAQPLDQNIRALQRDCPGGMRLGLRWLRGAR